MKPPTLPHMTVQRHACTRSLKMNQKPVALHAFGQSFALDQKNTNVLIGLGSIFQDFNDHGAALKKYSNCNFHNPNSAELWNNIGMCFYGYENYINVKLFLSINKQPIGNLLLEESSILQPLGMEHLLQYRFGILSDGPICISFPLFLGDYQIQPKRR